MSDLFTERLAQVKAAVKALEARIDAANMTGKISTDNLVRLLTDLELAHNKPLDPVSQGMEFELKALGVAVERVNRAFWLYYKHNAEQEVRPACVSDTVLACCMYTAYCKDVGGRSFNGDLLPDWDTLLKDPAKAKIVAGWMAAANAATLTKG